MAAIIITETEREAEQFTMLARSLRLPLEVQQALKPGMTVSDKARMTQSNLDNLARLKEEGTSLAMAPDALRIWDFPELQDIYKNDTVNLKKLLGDLQRSGYEKQSKAERIGDFMLRGDTLEVIGPDNSGYRIELFGDMVENIFRLDESTRKKGEKVEKITLYGLNPRSTGQDLATFAEAVFIYRPESWSAETRTSLPQNLQATTISSLPVKGQVQTLISVNRIQLAKYLAEAKRVYLASIDIATAKKALQEIDDEIIPEEILLAGPVDGGFWDSSEKELVITDADLGLRTKLQRKKISISDFAIGDFVVHTEHGIGRVTSMEPMTIAGITREYLIIQYAEKDKLYLPVDQVDKVVKYVATDNREPRLARLHTEHFREALQKIKKDTLVYAKKLLELYAERVIQRGQQVKIDPETASILDESFEFELTPDQRRVLSEVLDDMSKPKPMDRLLTADVGFGKTEISIRAALHAALNGQQVAVLAPTTVLAEQHFHTFSKRLKQFGVAIAAISRFRSESEQSGILRELAEGKLDILIGTHRLLSRDIKFKKLGLLIIDEEQKFGVKHKELLKEWKKDVDVLTMTATPIPRTLNFALAGLRELSSIETPPEGRKPIETFVEPLDLEKLANVIEAEVGRRGQVYIIFNEVQKIESFQLHLQKLLPDVSFLVAHAQMDKRSLQKRMQDFEDGKYDCLVASTIIENGIDNPNVNTLIVVNAQNFGLSQLHQLRGRVGRGDKEAYAYFFYVEANMSKDAIRRLEALAEHSYLGAGKEIALKDLQIRGAGGVLSTRQSGHVRAVGLALYNRLLAHAIEELRTGRRIAVDSVTIDLPIEAYIPDGLGEEGARLDIYQRLAQAEAPEEIEDIRNNLIKKFGELSLPILNLISLTKLKLRAYNLQEFDRITYKSVKLDGLKSTRIEFRHVDGVVEAVNIKPSDDVLEVVDRYLSTWEKEVEGKD